MVGKVYKCTIVNTEGETVSDYVRSSIQAEAYESTGFTIELVDESEMTKNKGGRPKKEE